jgi:hypothetical protein
LVADPPILGAEQANHIAIAIERGQQPRFASLRNSPNPFGLKTGTYRLILLFASHPFDINAKGNNPRVETELKSPFQVTERQWSTTALGSLGKSVGIREKNKADLHVIRPNG